MGMTCLYILSFLARWRLFPLFPPPKQGGDNITRLISVLSHCSHQSHLKIYVRAESESGMQFKPALPSQQVGTVGTVGTRKANYSRRNSIRCSHQRAANIQPVGTRSDGARGEARVTQQIGTSRAGEFRRRFGSDAATVELDALPAAELRPPVEEAVVGLVDLERWDRHVEVQEIELTCIAQFGETIRSLPQG
jgi:hypothetical protein